MLFFDKWRLIWQAVCRFLRTRIRIGSAFRWHLLKGSGHNDAFCLGTEGCARATKNSGGIQGESEMARRSFCGWPQATARSGKGNNKPIDALSGHTFLLAKVVYTLACCRDEQWAM